MERLTKEAIATLRMRSDISGKRWQVVRLVDLRLLLDTAEREAAQAVEIAALKAEIDATWFHIDHGYSIEPRSLFEQEAPKNGFKYALAQAIQHVWKRDPKVAALTQERDALRAAIDSACISLECRDGFGHYCPNCDRGLYSELLKLRAALAPLPSDEMSGE